MRIEGENWFPYLPSRWLNRLVGLVRRSVPSRIDIDWCMEGDRFSFSRANASQFVSQLETLGWLDGEGSLTDAGRNLRLSADAYQSFMLQEVSRIYDELAQQLDDPELDAVALETYFTSASNLGLSGRRQVITTFRWFLAQAGLTGVVERVGGAPVAAAARQDSGVRQTRRARTRRDAGAASGSERGAGAAAGRLPLPSGLAGITLSISLQLPAVDDERVYQAIFKAMREHLFGQGSATE